MIQILSVYGIRCVNSNLKLFVQYISDFLNLEFSFIVIQSTEPAINLFPHISA